MSGNLTGLCLYANPSIFLFSKCRFSTDRVKKESIVVKDYFLYAIFVSPLFDIASLINFADDNFCLVWDRSLVTLIDNLEKRLEMIVKLFKGVRAC